MPLEDSYLRATLGFPKEGTLWETAVVIQGPHYPDVTPYVIQQMYEKNRNIFVVISTFLPEDEDTGVNPIGSFLTSFEKDRLKEGRLACVFIRQPTREELPDFWRTNHMNQNLQRLTSYAGVKFASDHGITFALKIRSDLFFLAPNVIRRMRVSIGKFPPFDKRMKGRIALVSHGTFDHPYPYHLSDFWFFGYTSDLLKFFDITSASSWNYGSGMPMNQAPEANLAIVWTRDLDIHCDSMLDLAARYLVIEDHYDVLPFRILWREVSLQKHIAAIASGKKMMYNLDESPGSKTMRSDWMKRLKELMP